MLDKFTYGNSKVATDLVDMLNMRYHPSIASKVSRSITSQFKIVNQICRSLDGDYEQIEKQLSLYLQHRKLALKHTPACQQAQIDEALKTRVNNLVETKVKRLIDAARKLRYASVTV